MLLRPDRDAVGRRARDSTRANARTFWLAAGLLPRGLRDDVFRLYLVFRTLDDLVDEGDPQAERRVAAVEVWAHTGAASSPESEVLADLSARHDLPREAFVDFCAGMRDDLVATSYATEAELDRYCQRVAGTVGLVMAALLGTRSPHASRHAAALGRAMQRTNIIRDIDEDLAAGRTYVSAEAQARFGPPLPGRREALLRDQVARADALYEEGEAGIPMLVHGRPAIAAAAAMYREILRQIEREGYGCRSGRVVVPRSRKLLVVARALT